MPTDNNSKKSQLTVLEEIRDGNLTNSQLRGEPLPVSFAVTSVYMQEKTAIAVSDACTLLVAANPNRVGIRFRNAAGDPVAIGSSTLTWATRVPVLSENDFCTEGGTLGDAPSIAWYGICAADQTASVTIQEVLK